MLCLLAAIAAALVPPQISPVGRARVARPVVCQQQQQVTVRAGLDDEKVEQLFAWISRAFAGERQYNNLMLAFAAIFGDHAKGSDCAMLVDNALASMPPENQPCGEAVTLREREMGSLGAMGANQWTGRFRTRPHALLDVRHFSSVDDWVSSLSRGSRRTLAKAAAQDFSVVPRPIYGNEPAPHSSLAHFRCVAEHEVRLLATSPDNFFDALNQAIGRYVGCTSQSGVIQEYRDADGRVIAFSQEVQKGRVIRGQWFYATDAAAKSYVWFHSVHDLVRRAIETDGVDMVDLGPSGSDAFSALKERYGFESVDDWHTVADYRGPFQYESGPGPSWADLDPPDWLFGEESSEA